MSVSMYKILMFVAVGLLSVSFASVHTWALDDSHEVEQIDWKKKIVGRKVTTGKDGARQAKLRNGRLYVLKDGFLIEKIDNEDVPIYENVFDFDSGIVIHKFRAADTGTGKCSTSITPFGDVRPERVEEMRSLSCYIVGTWYSLVSRGETKNPFYHNHCKGRYDDR